MVQRNQQVGPLLDKPVSTMIALTQADAPRLALLRRDRPTRDRHHRDFRDSHPKGMGNKPIPAIPLSSRITPTNSMCSPLIRRSSRRATRRSRLIRSLRSIRATPTPLLPRTRLLPTGTSRPTISRRPPSRPRTPTAARRPPVTTPHSSIPICRRRSRPRRDAAPMVNRSRCPPTSPSQRSLHSRPPSTAPSRHRKSRR